MQPEASSKVFVRAAQNEADIRQVVALTGQSFPEECGTMGARGGAGLNLRQWADIESADFTSQPWLWPGCGLAVEQAAEGEEKVLGAVVLAFENERDESMSYWEVSKRVGCLATAHTWLYDQILEEPLADHECLIDFIAVSPNARGKGVGLLLMAWAQETGATILARTVPDAVAAHGSLMTLWVAADNAVALKLYKKSGYEVVYKTDDGLCHCIMSRLFKGFLGHPVWYKMCKQLHVPEGSVILKPTEIAMPKRIAISAVTVASSAAEPLPAQCDCQAKISPHNPQPGVIQPIREGVAAGGLLKELPPQQPLVLGGEAPCAQCGAGSNSELVNIKAAGEASGSGSSDGSSTHSNGSGSSALCGSAETPALLPFARTISNSAAAASIAHLVRRASESERTSVQAMVAAPPLVRASFSLKQAGQSTVQFERHGKAQVC